jgi:DNA-binding MarR family transcriptional regulator
LAKRQEPNVGVNDLGALKNLAEDYLAVLIIAIANRLTRGASKFYREGWNLGVVEWRIMICLGYKAERPIGEIAEAADLDRGATSRSIKLLSERGLVRTETGAGRINRARLTKKGEELLQHLRAAGRRREGRLMSTFNSNERKRLLSFFRRLLSQVDFMNAGASSDTRSSGAAGKNRKKRVS